MTEWYYEDSGQSRGPVKEDELRTLLADGLVPATSLIWHASYGQEWRTASDAGFTVRSSPSAPPPIGGAVSRPTPPPITGAPIPARAGSDHPTSATSSYSPTYANLIAAVPLIIMGIEIVVLAAGVSPYNPAFERGGIWWTVILSFVFAYKDAKAINAAGLNPQNKPLVPFMLLSQIGYFWRRRAVAGLAWKPLWLWLGALVIYVVWTAMIYA